MCDTTLVGPGLPPAPLYGPSSPSVHATTGEGDGERGGVGGGGGIGLCRMCPCVSAHFLRAHVFPVRRFLAFYMGVVMGCFVPLAFTAFFLGRTCTLEEEVEEEEDEEEEELLASSEDYLNPAFSGARKRAELLHNPYVLGGSQKGGQNQKWLHHPCLLGGPYPQL